MNPPFLVAWSASAERQVAKLDPQVARRILDGVEAYRRTGYGDVKKLTGRGDFRLRIGAYRVIFELDHASNTMSVLRVDDRKEAYR